MTTPYDLAGVNVTRTLIDRVQPERIEHVRMSSGASLTLPVLTPVSVDYTTGLWIPWAPPTASAIYNQVRGFIWPYEYGQETAIKTVSVMTAGVVPLDQILNNGWSAWINPSPSPDGLLYLAFTNYIRNPAYLRHDIHITGQGDSFA